LKKFASFDICVASDAAQEYLDSVGSKIADPVCLWLHACNRFDHMVKQTRKPNADTSVQSEFKRAATITYHGKDVTQVASSVFRQVTEKFLGILNDNICVPILENHDMAQWFNNRKMSIDEYKTIEIDISKMDKSQNEVHQLIQDYMFEFLGVDKEFIALWHDCHIKSVMSETGVGFQFSTLWQRRTGDACTLLGNTIVTAVINNYILNFKNFSCVGVVGDDFTGLYRSNLKFNLDHYTSVFNFSVKSYISTSSLYLCSKYIMKIGNAFYAVPDPLRLAQRLGRRDIPADEDLLREVFTGMKDSTRSLFVEGVAERLTQLMANKYKKSARTVVPAITAMKQCMASFENFKNLFFTDVDDNAIVRLHKDIVSDCTSKYRRKVRNPR
jgi:hypothetical protein